MVKRKIIVFLMSVCMLTAEVKIPALAAELPEILGEQVGADNESQLEENGLEGSNESVETNMIPEVLPEEKGRLEGTSEVENYESSTQEQYVRETEDLEAYEEIMFDTTPTWQGWEAAGNQIADYPSIMLNVPYYPQSVPNDCGISSIAMTEATALGYGTEEFQTVYNAVYEANGRSVIIEQAVNEGKYNDHRRRLGRRYGY